MMTKVFLKLVIVWMSFTVSASNVNQRELPQLQIEAPDSLSTIASHIRGFQLNRLSGIMTLIGLTKPGPPIRVLLLPEESLIAKDTPTWIAAFADTSQELVVLFPSRIGSYPYNSLEGVLYHELAHILVARAASNAPIPRWFNEGLASTIERDWGLEMRSRFMWEVMVGGPLTATELENLFTQGEREIVRAYVLAETIVRDLLAHHGSMTPALILAKMANGAPFEQALYATTGLSVQDNLNSFWKRQLSWQSWIQIIGTYPIIWSFITLLALIAIWKHRRRRAKQRVEWEQAEQVENLEWKEHRRRYRVH